MPKSRFRDATITALAAIIAALIGAGVTLYVEHEKIEAVKQDRDKALRQVETYQAKYENAPKAFIEQLGTLIDTAPKFQNVQGTDIKMLTQDPEYRRSISVRARAIVAARNDLRSSLDDIGNRLDSQIDELQAELSKPNPDPEKLISTLEVLQQKWPSKQAEIELAVRKLQTELGFVPIAVQ